MIFMLLPTVQESSGCSISSPTLGVANPFNVRNSNNKYIVVFYCGFICISLKANDADNFSCIYLSSYIFFNDMSFQIFLRLNFLKTEFFIVVY
jgi:hypothetical protein